MKSERWCDIPDYEGRYQVSTRGRVQALDRIDDGGLHRTAKMLRCLVRANGRRFVTVYRRAIRRTYCVSLLLARAYGIPNPQGKGYVIHRNHDNGDFRRGNLAWATLLEQRMHDGTRFTCPYYGVTRVKRGRYPMLQWVAFFRVNKRRYDLGYFATPEEAAHAYDREVRRRRLARPLNGLRKPPTTEFSVPSLPGEIWRRFPGAAPVYQISNLGRVRTVAHHTRQGQRVRPRLRRLHAQPTGGKTVLLKDRRFGIAKALARAFPNTRLARGGKRG